MNIESMLRDTGAVETITRELGVDHSTAQAGVQALLPSVLSGFQTPGVPDAHQFQGSRQSDAAGAGGLGGLLGKIIGLGGGGLLDNVQSSEPTQVNKGNDILGQIFGSKDRSRAVASEASTQSGVEPTLLKKMLPIVAMAVAGYVMKQAGGFGGSNGAGPSGMPGGLTSQGGQPGGSANILGDLIGAAGKYLGR